MPGKIKSIREKKKNLKKTEKEHKLALITEKLAENPEVVKMIQEENVESLGEDHTKKGNNKLLKIGIPIVLVVLLLTGAVFFILKNGLFPVSNSTSGSEESAAEKQNKYTQAQTYYSEGNLYDASVLFTFLGDYEKCKEMLGKINLESTTLGKGNSISEYIGSDVVNHYITANMNYDAINTALGVTDTTAKTDSTTEATTDESKKKETKIKYDESVIETVNEKTNALITAGNLVSCLNLNSNNVMCEAHESLKRSANYGNQAAWKIQEGVKNGTYQPNSTNEVTQEVTSLIDSMNQENAIFLQQVDQILSGNLLEMVSTPELGTSMKRYAQSIYAFYK